MSSFALKIIAILSMFLDHLGYTIYEKFSFLNYMGRISFPIFAFQISEGYTHTRSKKNYLLRLLVFAIISQLPFMLFCSIFNSEIYLNIFFTLFIGLLCIILFEKCKNKYLGIIIISILCLFAEFIKVDYGYWGVLVIFAFHIFKNNKILMNISFIILVLLKYVPLLIKYNFYYAYFILAICTTIPLIFINLYNGKKGHNAKYLLYAFYPVHLIILYLINLFFI